MSFKIKLTIEYDGTAYWGWQYQEEFPSIQGHMLRALKELFQEEIPIVTASRTDKGVHAINQVISFETTKDPRNYNMLRAFQAYLPPDIVVKKAELMPPNFHAQHMALSKNYIYRIWNHPAPTAIHGKRSLWIRKPLDIDRLNEAAQMFLGTHDFSCLQSEGTPLPHAIRTVNSLKFIKSGDFIEFHINGSGFVKQMVRNMVGTLLQTQLGDRTLESLPELLASKDRTLAGPTVEPQGLYLEQVFYPPELDKLAQPL